MRTDITPAKIPGGATGSACSRADLTVDGHVESTPSEPENPAGRERLFPASRADRRLHFEEAGSPKWDSLSKLSFSIQLWQALKWLLTLILSLLRLRPAPDQSAAEPESPAIQLRRVARKISTSTIESELSGRDVDLNQCSIASFQATPIKTPKILDTLLDCSFRRHRQSELPLSQKQISALGQSASKFVFGSPRLQRTQSVAGRGEGEWLKSRLQETLRARLHVDSAVERTQMAEFKPETGRFQTTFHCLSECSPNKVYLSRHKLEEKLYIVRKLNFPRGFRGPAGQHRIREVLETLQGLCHPNLAKYVTAWVEEEAPHNSNTFTSLDRFPDDDLPSPCPNSPAKSAPEVDDVDLFRSATFKMPTLPSAAEINERIRPLNADINLEVEFGAIDRPSFPSNASTSSSETEFLENSNLSLKLFVQYEYCDGMSLGAILNTHGGVLEDEEVFAVANEALSAIRYLHSQGLEMGKLGTDNVFVCEDGSVKLCRSMTPYLPKASSNFAKASKSGDFDADFTNLGLLIYELLGKFKTNHERVLMVRRARQTRTLPLDVHRKLGVRAVLIEALIGHSAAPKTADKFIGHGSFRHWQQLVSQKVLHELT